MKAESLRCPVCSDVGFSPPTRLDTGSEAAELRVSYKIPGAAGLVPKLLGSPKKEVFNVWARCCLHCGHLLLALGPEDLERLKNRLPDLEPSPVSTYG